MKRKILPYIIVFVFALVFSVHNTPKLTYASLELPQCQDGLDNDTDGAIDNTDPQCHTDGDLLNAFSYDANIDNEASPLGSGGLKLPQCQDGLDNDGDGVIDDMDPQCHTDGDVLNPFSYDANIDNEASPVIVVVPVLGGGGGGSTPITTSGSIPTFYAPPVGQVLGVSTGPTECGGLTGRPCSLQKTGGVETPRLLLNRKANALAKKEHNELIIPKLGINKPILNYQSTDSLFQESMVLPWTSTPDKGGNTVLVGHAYYLRDGKYSKSTFYELDTMKEGDEITMYWKNVKYTYIVTESKKVTPDQISIEDQTTTPTLTIYSCGRFTNMLRTVVVATLKA